MATINNVDFDAVVQEALAAARGIMTEDWEAARDIIENIAQGLVNDVAFIAKKKASGEFTEEDARIYLEDQKMLARIRLRSLAIISLQVAERIWNAVAQVFRKAIQQSLHWTLL